MNYVVSVANLLSIHLILTKYYKHKNDINDIIYIYIYIFKVRYYNVVYYYVIEK